MRALLLGSTGFTGQLLLRLLLEHPRITSVIPISHTLHGKKVQLPKIDRQLITQKLGETEEKYAAMSTISTWGADVLFSALPHGQSAPAWKRVVEQTIIIDLAADMRIPDAALFAKLYQSEYFLPEKRANTAYGIPELFKTDIVKAEIIANPGCFPTAALIPLLPLSREKLLQRSIHIMAITGISGAGKSADSNYLYAIRTENSGAYKAGRSHRHWGEMTHYLPGHDLLFTPHLAPLSRGIALTAYAALRSGATQKDIIYAYNQQYNNAPFVRYTQDRLPQTADVRGSNRCDFTWQLEDDNTLLIFSAIDNLMKGAASQAIQNMNIRFDFNETDGLPISAER